MRRLLLSFICILLCVAGTASATALIVDRGLPVTNLNNAAGASRSNVSWSFGEWDPLYYAGDDFMLQAGTWRVDTIRTWVTAGPATDSSFDLASRYETLTLYGGSASGGIADPLMTGTLLAGNTTDNANISITRVQYADSSDYQGSSGSMISLWQVDFTNLNWYLAGNELQLFSVVGTDRPTEDGYRPWFMHASNAALGGAPADGADNAWRALYADGSALTFDSFVTTEGWDKPSDINVQVYGQAVPEPATLFLLGSGLLLVARRTKKS